MNYSNAIILGQEVGSLPIHHLSQRFLLRMNIKLIKDHDILVSQVVKRPFVCLAVWRLFGAERRTARLGELYPHLTHRSLSGITRKMIMADVFINLSTSTFWRSATVLQPNASINSFVQAIACSVDLVKTGLPLWAITFLKYLCEPSTKGSHAANKDGGMHPPFCSFHE